MDADLLFRFLFVLIYGIFAVIRVIYRVPASRKPGRRVNLERSGVLVSTIILCLLVSMVLYIISPEWMRWSHLELPRLIRWAGVGMAVVLILLVVWIHHTLGKFYSARLEIREGHEVVTTGPYSRVRHPMYAVLYVFGLSLGLVSANIMLLVFSVFLIYPLRLITIREEQMMLDRFGDEYRDYMRRTGRLFPRLW